MNYRHQYHAGNFADVIKHVVLVQIIEHLKAKETGFFVLDTHAGIGMYDLLSKEAQKTGEAQNGVSAILKHPDILFHPLTALYAQLIQQVNSADCATAARYYPGSPALVGKLLRIQDRFIANELHTEDYTLLCRTLSRFPKNIKVLHLDGYMALRANLPPKERRGLVLIDPPFESKDEFSILATHLKEAIKRWRHGIYMLWFPLKLHLPVHSFYEAIQQLGISNSLLIEAWIRPPYTPESLNGCGIIILNTPWKLKEDIQRCRKLFVPDILTKLVVRWLLE